MIKIPPYLKPGNKIAITCPAGYTIKEKALRCIETLQGWGFEVILGKTLGSNSQNYFSGTDEERVSELQEMIDDKNIDAILFGRGGYGLTRIIDMLNFKKFIKRPKWLIGYSDITVLHTHVLNNYGIASMHAPMAGAFNEIESSSEYIESLHKSLTGEKIKYTCQPHELNREGEVSGQLTGGNLSLLANVIGTASDFDTKNKILFIEDTGEYLYNVDRMLYHLKRSRKFDKLAGLIIGGFTEMKDTERPFGKPIDQLIHDIISEYDFPVCYNFPVSHTKENVALKIGLPYRLKITATTTILKEQ